METDPPKMCEYLVHLFHEGKAITSIENAHSGLLSVLKHGGKYTERATTVSDCLTSLWKERPRTRKICTDWDINHVLDSFLKSPYIDELGSDRTIPLRQLTTKTAFLVALACSRRRSEIHAFSRNSALLRQEKNQNSGEHIVTIHTSPGFLAKKQEARALYPEVTLRSIAHLYPTSLRDRLLCPVRTLNIYLERTKTWANPKSLLFVNPIEGRNMTASSLSSWLKAAITGAYVGQRVKSLHCNPHEIRAVAASIGVFNHATVTEILSAGTWRRFTTFTDNYLRDVGPVGSINGNPHYRLPAYVAAGSVVPNSTQR